MENLPSTEEIHFPLADITEDGEWRQLSILNMTVESQNEIVGGIILLKLQKR